MIRFRSFLPRAAAPALALAAAAISAPDARADSPAVVVDILPVHSLVARVMDGVGSPELVVPPGASPHGFAMRPSQARKLASADLVVWVGEGLTPWLEDSLDSLAPDAARLTLLELPGLPLLENRESASFDAHEDEHGDSHGDDDDHEGEHHDDDHEHEHEAHHEDGDGDHHDHDHGLYDPHAWLDPEIAAAWLVAIAEELTRIDPDHAEIYAANAEEGTAELTALQERIDAQLAPVRGTPFIVFHDAYSYFERRFDVSAAGAVSLGDARAPGAARVSEIRSRIEEADAACVFSEPQFEPKLVATLIEGTGARSGVLDPLGASLEPGPDLYPALLGTMADSLVECLAGANSN